MPVSAISGTTPTRETCGRPLQVSIRKSPPPLTCSRTLYRRNVRTGSAAVAEVRRRAERERRRLHRRVGRGLERERHVDAAAGGARGLRLVAVGKRAAGDSL